MDYLAFRPRGALGRGFWRRAFDLCNATDPYREALARGDASMESVAVEKGTFLSTEHVLDMALQQMGVRVHRLLDQRRAENPGHAAHGIDALGIWHAHSPKIVRAWRYVPSLIWGPLEKLILALGGYQ